MHRQFRSGLLATAASLLTLVGVSCSNAQTIQYDVPAEALGQALKDLANKANVRVVASSDLVAGKTSSAVVGARNADEALSSLLVGTGLHAELVAEAWVIRPNAGGGTTPSAGVSQGSEITVTGTRIQKGAIASPVITLTQADMMKSGQTNVGEALRSLPQDFNGGQNPGVTSGLGVPNQNATGGSGANLRGLGPDATLTLLNGHRLAYGSFVQSVDIGSIPLAAIDRLDVVPDGASAIYGSDAVGGVVNILLKPDFEGIAMSARLGAATDGGDQEQQYDLTSGHSWGSGGFLVSYDFQRNTPITSRERQYTLAMPQGNTLYPGVKQHSVVASGHQSIGSAISFGADLTYNHRDQRYAVRTSATTGYIYANADTSFSISPWIKAQVGPWLLSANGLYGGDRNHFIQSSANSVVSGCDCNNARVIEGDAEGPLIHLGGGDARLAIGGGYRRNGFREYDIGVPNSTISASQDSYYGFAELFAPLVSPDRGLSFVNRLSFDGAIRYERYPGTGHVATPKFGLVYAPTPDFDLKSSWGKSFKAPSLYNLYSGSYAALYQASILGGARFPAGSTVMLQGGGNPDLKPERATSWTVTLVAHPRALPGVRFEIGYFHIDYRDRIVSPLAGSAVFTALSDPAYSDFVVYEPTPVEQAAAISGAGQGFTNASGAAYDPANVVALVDNRSVNAATQHIRGIDLAADYRVDLSPGQSLGIKGAGSWLDSHQQLSASAPTTALSGTIFNPPHWRGRLIASWALGNVILTPALNYVGGLTDILTTPHLRVHSMTTVDFTGIVNVGHSSGLLKGLSLTLTVRNLLNQHPPFSPPSGGAVYYVPYDSTNYSAIGRFVGLTVSKSW